MIRLELLELTKEYVRYKFFPDDEGNDFGVVQVDRRNLKRSLVQETKAGDSTWYRLHAWNSVARFIEKNNFPEKIVIGWC